VAVAVLVMGSQVEVGLSQERHTREEEAEEEDEKEV